MTSLCLSGVDFEQHNMGRSSAAQAAVMKESFTHLVSQLSGKSRIR